MKRRRWIGTAAVGLSLLATPHAVADPLPLNNLVVNGSVYALAQDSAGRTYLGGVFSKVGPRLGHAVKLSTTNDQPALPFPDVNDSVSAIVSDGAGGWYISGQFTFIGGVPRNHLAHINADGTLDPTWNPTADGGVSALLLSGTDLFVGG